MSASIMGTAGQAAVRTWYAESLPLRQLVEDSPAALRVFDQYREALAHFGSGDRAVREAERALVLALPDRRKDARRAWAAHNDQGIHLLASARRSSRFLAQEVETLVQQAGEPDWGDRAAAVEDLRQRFNEALCSVTLDDDELRGVDAALTEAWDFAAHGEVREYGQFLDRLLGRLAETRSSLEKSRQRPQMFFVPWWKVAAIIVAFGVFLYAFFKCGFFGCSASEAAVVAGIGSIATIVAVFC